MVDKKYYFIVYECTQYGWNSNGISTGRTIIKSQDVIDIHPLDFQIECNKKYGNEHKTSGGHTIREEYFVLTWNELTVDEYIKYKDQVG